MSCLRVDAIETAEFLKENDNFYILTHSNPDGDTIGSGYALNAVLKAMGKRTVILCGDPIPPKLKVFECIEEPNFEPKTIVAVDIADERLLGNLKAQFQGKIDLCIDHHGSNNGYAKRLFLEADSASCCECVFEVVKQLEVSITPDIASALYLGMATDTGCFKYSSTTPRTHKFAAELMELGANFYEINRSFFETKSKARLKLERDVLEALEFFKNGRAAAVTITRAMIEESGCEQTDLDSVSSLPREIDGVMIGVAIKEQPSGAFRVSVRTLEPYDASEICKAFGGGGHKRAAGCEFKCELAGVKAALFSKISELLEEEE